MNRILKYILLSLCGAVILLCMVYAVFAGKDIRRSLRCERLEICISDSLENSFVSREDVKIFLDKGYGEYIGVALDSLDLVKIESIVDGRSAVKKSQAYVTKDGALHIDIVQRKPIVRFQKKNGGFYADAEGFIFPLQNSFASHVQIIDGNIPIAANSGYKGQINDGKEMKWFRDMMALINYLEGSRKWKDKIVQIHVGENGDLILIPREGKERIVFGKPEHVEERLATLEKYYTTIIPEKGEDRYREVDLRFKGQIICR